MTDEKILELAQQAGMRFTQSFMGPVWGGEPEQLRKFAALVRREALEEAASKCARIGDCHQEREGLRPTSRRTDAETGACECEFATRALAAKDVTPTPE